MGLPSVELSQDSYCLWGWRHSCKGCALLREKQDWALCINLYFFLFHPSTPRTTPQPTHPPTYRVLVPQGRLYGRLVMVRRSCWRWSIPYQKHYNVSDVLWSAYWRNIWWRSIEARIGKYRQALHWEHTCQDLRSSPTCWFFLWWGFRNLRCVCLDQLGRRKAPWCNHLSFLAVSRSSRCFCENQMFKRPDCLFLRDIAQIAPTERFHATLKRRVWLQCLLGKKR